MGVGEWPRNYGDSRGHYDIFQKLSIQMEH